MVRFEDLSLFGKFKDLAWHAAVRQGCAAHTVTLAGFWVVTRYGWLDPDTGESRTWKRLRLKR